MHPNARNLARLLLLACPLALAGCLSFSSTSTPRPAEHTTVVVPPGSATTVVCANGAAAPCN